MTERIAKMRPWTLLFVLQVLVIHASVSTAHSWLDCSNMLPSGCAGFPLGYPSRADVDINTKYTYLIQDRRPNAPVCQPGRQDIPGNNPFPPASVTPGQTLHLTWQPDGHLNDARPSLVEVHWTGVPGRRLHTRSELSPATLLGAMTFATSGNCDQSWEPNTWCHGYLTIPWGTQPGTYQLIWWWKYDRNPSGEEYSTCFEIVVHRSTMHRRNLPVRAPSSTFSPPQKREDKGEPLQGLQMAYTTANRMETNNGAFTEETKDGEAIQNTATLAELVTKPDQDGKRNRGQSNRYYAGDETGALAGDAINDQEGVDASPLPIVTPTQLIHNMLLEQVKTPDGDISNSNGTSSTSENQSLLVTHGSSPTSSNTTGVPSSQSESNSTEHGQDSHLNQTSIGQMPTLDNGASDIASHPLLPGQCMALFACALVTLTWMLV